MKRKRRLLSTCKRRQCREFRSFTQFRCIGVSYRNNTTTICSCRCHVNEVPV